jgi:hypothetical protein
MASIIIATAVTFTDSRTGGSDPSRGGTAEDFEDRVVERGRRAQQEPLATMRNGRGRRLRDPGTVSTGKIAAPGTVLHQVGRVACAGRAQPRRACGPAAMLGVWFSAFPTFSPFSLRCTPLAGAAHPSSRAIERGGRWRRRGAAARAIAAGRRAYGLRPEAIDNLALRVGRKIRAAVPKRLTDARLAATHGFGRRRPGRLPIRSTTRRRLGIQRQRPRTIGMPTSPALNQLLRCVRGATLANAGYDARRGLCWFRAPDGSPERCVVQQLTKLIVRSDGADEPTRSPSARECVHRRRRPQPPPTSRQRTFVARTPYRRRRHGRRR